MTIPTAPVPASRLGLGLLVDAEPFAWHWAEPEPRERATIEGALITGIWRFSPQIVQLAFDNFPPLRLGADQLVSVLDWLPVFDPAGA